MVRLFLLLFMVTNVIYAKSEGSKIVSIGGSLSEVICALDHCSDIVAADATSLYPPQLLKLPRLPYIRQINAEGVLRMGGDKIFIVEDAGPSKEIEKIKELGPVVKTFPSEPSMEGAIKRITQLGQELGKVKQAEKLIEQLKEELAVAQQMRKNLPKKIKALFVYSRGKGKFLGAGKDTAADSMFSLLGITNAFEGDWYKQLSSESLLAMDPDVIIFPRRGNENFNYEDMKSRMAGLSLTKAYKNKSFILVDDLKFMGFTHRFGQGAQELIHSIQGLSWLN